ncbi:MAG: hypothetical protein JRI84_12645 [Deltaproteobacteria bacterium]|nr:hypothetical protein [Deltaproteobacteria bacterium]
MKNYYQLMAMARLAELSRFGQEEEARKLIELLALDDDGKLSQDVSQILEMEAMPQMIEPDPFFPPPSREQVNMGSVFIGHTLDGYPVTLSTKKHLANGIFIAGEPGTGKTTVLRNIAVQVAMSGKKILWVDQKDDSACLIGVIPDFMYINLKDLPWNPFEPDEYDDENSWYLTVASIYRKNFGTFQAGESTVYQDLVSLNRKIKARNKEDYACPLDLLEYVKEKPVPRGSEFARYRDREILRLWTICDAYGPSIRYSRGVRTKTLLSMNLGIGMEGRSPDTKGFFADTTYVKLINHRLRKRDKRNDLENLFILDDAKIIMDRGKEKVFAQGVATMTHYLNLSREFGIGYAFADHHPHLILSGVFSVSKVKIMMALSHGEDIMVMSRALGLTSAQKLEAHRLNKGQAVVQISGDDYTEPFFITTPNITFEEVAREEIEKRRERLRKRLMEGVRQRSNLVYRIMREEKARTGLNGDDLTMIQDINSYPFKGLTERYSSLGWTTNRGQKVVKQLENRGWINLAKAGKLVLAELTEKTRAYMRELGIPARRFRRGGVLTNYYIEKMRIHFEKKGYKVKTEAKLGDYYTDLLLIGKDSERWGLEFALSPDYQVHNIKKLLPFDLSGILVVSANREVIKAIRTKARNALKPRDLKKVHFRIVKDLLRDQQN